jgi:hypothetical protein
MTNSHDPKPLPLTVMIDDADNCSEVGCMPNTIGSGYLDKIRADSTMDPAISSEMRQSPTVPCMNVHIMEDVLKETATPRVPSSKKHQDGVKLPKLDPLKVTTPPNAAIVDGNTASILADVETCTSKVLSAQSFLLNERRKRNVPV